MLKSIEKVEAELDQLSVAELLALLDKITTKLRDKTANDQKNQPKELITAFVDDMPLPGTYRPSREEIEASLKRIFTAEEYANLGKTDFSKLPKLPKTMTEYIDEERGD